MQQRLKNSRVSWQTLGENSTVKYFVFKLVLCFFSDQDSEGDFNEMQGSSYFERNSSGGGGTCVSTTSGLRIGSRKKAAMQLRQSSLHARRRVVTRAPSSTVTSSSVNLLDNILDSQRLLSLSSDHLVTDRNGKCPHPSPTYPLFLNLYKPH